MRLIVCLDFDGVLHSYTSGWQGAGVVSDPPVHGAMQYIHKLYQADFIIAIYSSRSSQPGGIEEMQGWLFKHLGNYFREEPEDFERVFRAIEWPTSKPPAFITIDDRAIQFQGDFTAAELQPNAIRNFKPWNKK